MDTSNSILNVKVYDLKYSDKPEDREQATDYERLLGLIIAKLKPILRYVCAPVTFDNLLSSPTYRCLRIGEYSDRLFPAKTDVLFLSETGAFFYGYSNADTRHKDLQILGQGKREPSEIVRDGDDSWINMPFADLLERLKAALDEAERKRRGHLEALAARNAFLNRISAAIQE